MGEVVVSSDEALELEVLREAELEIMKCDSAGGSSVTVRWERFLPRMVLRVLLVEADDSTRQIITALLKKCSYKVAAVPDGLKAWEVLRGNAHNIDLILTEVELPSISGFALLTLIMEHETCKNIPVIMMSSNDSISTVYNCMLRGAADFLVKPVRRNELKNLWQHVWRRQSRLAIIKSSPQDESVALKKVEATAENNSNHSSGYKSCEMTSKDKGNDSQTSCTKPEVEAESTCMENLQGPSQLEWSRSMTGELGTQIQNHGGTVTSTPQLLLKQENEAAGISLYQMPASIDEARSVFWKMNVEHSNNREDPNNTSDACDNNSLLLSTSKTAIDLIGAFDNSSYQNPGPITGQNKFDSFPQLDLSLRRSHFCGSEGTDEKQTLNHSNASAFAPYVNNKASLPLHPMPHSLFPQEEEFCTNNDRNLPTHVLGYNSDTSVSTLKAPGSMLSMATGHLKEAQAPPCPQGRAIPSSVPVSNLKFDGPPMFHTQSGPAPPPSSDSHQDGAMLQNKCQSNIETGGSKPIRTNQEDPKLELDDDQGQFSTATVDHESAGVRFCNGTSNQQNSIVCGSICGSNGSSYPSAMARHGSDGGNVEGLSGHDGSTHKSSQREAALNKFRMKRKDRCFEKKVRYESRKKLAEQRPRVKGQFVRQVQVEHASLGAEYC